MQSPESSSGTHDIQGVQAIPAPKNWLKVLFRLYTGLKALNNIHFVHVQFIDSENN